MISAVIITYNEEDHIQNCIKSLESIVDEVILVDAKSEDKTIELAVEALSNIKTYVKSWEGYGAAKNFGSAQAKNDWILSLDADEQCSLEMRDQIIETSLSDDECYAFLRINHYEGRALRYGMLRPEWKPRLYNRNGMMWNDRLVHEQLTNRESHKKSTIEKLDGSLIHYPYISHADHVKSLQTYAKLSAAAWIKEDFKPGSVQKVLGPSYHFCRNHFFRLGFLEGRLGWETSKAAYLYSQYKYQAYDKLQRS